MISTFKHTTYYKYGSMSQPDYLVPPLRFNSVQPSLYRGGYPRKVNFPFLESLNIKTIVSLTPEPITAASDNSFYEFARQRGIELVHIECAQSGKGKKRGVPMGYSSVLEALKYIIHKEFAPVYLHCLNGGQVTSLVIACLRKLQFWSSIAIFNEFINYTTSITVSDRSFVDGFKGEIELNPEEKVDWLWTGFNQGVVASNSNFKVTQSKQEERNQSYDHLP